MNTAAANLLGSSHVDAATQIDDAGLSAGRSRDAEQQGKRQLSAVGIQR